jgi:ABC-type sugar transport system, periplasmic component
MKKKQGLRTIASLTLTTAIVASLTACGDGSNNESSTNSPAPSSEATNATAANTEASGEVNPFGFSPAIDVKVGFSFDSNFQFQGGETESKNTWMDLYNENGMKVTPMYSVDATQADTKLSTAIASGNYPDVFTLKGSNMVKYAQTGVIADLTEAYEKYATPELKAYMDIDKGASLTSAKVDGKLYAIPKVQNAYDNAMMMFVRQDWLDNLGLKMPTTMDELVEVARAFTKNDPDKNGKADTYGLALNGKEGFSTVSGLQAFFEGYGAAPGHWNGNFTFIEKDGKVSWGGDLPDEMKKGLTVLQDMYKEGTLAKNFGTMDTAAINKDLGSGKAGISFAPMWGAMTPVMDAVKNDINAHFTSAPIPDGNGTGSSKAYLSTLPDTYFVASSKFKNPEAVIKMANLGVQKLIHPKDDEEFYKYYGKVGSYSGWKFSLVPLVNPLKNRDNFEKDYAALQSGDTTGLNVEQKTNYDKMKAYLDSVKDNSFPDKVKASDTVVLSGLSSYTVFGDPQGGMVAQEKIRTTNTVNLSAYNYIPTDTMSSKYATLNKMALETIVKIIYGENVDSYDKFLKSWKALGGDTVTKEAQTWYDSNK